MKIPSHQLHHSIQEGDIFEANGFDFVCTGRDEEYLYCEQLIYENDMPSKLDLKYYPKTEKRLKSVCKFGRLRWKPNGITNNIEEYYNKLRAIHGFEKDCSIGLDERPDICSAGNCSVCQLIRKNLNPKPTRGSIGLTVD